MLDLDAEQPGKVVDEGALHILQYFLFEFRNGNSSYLVRHSTELKRIFGGDCDQAKARKFFQVRMARLSYLQYGTQMNFATLPDGHRNYECPKRR